MNRPDYITEAYRQLDNDEYYKRTSDDPIDRFKKELKYLIDSFPPEDKLLLAGAIPTDPKPGTFYMLPKIHKEGHPGRHIISGIGTLTENISGVVENILKPFVRDTPSYLKDTTDFLNKISSIKDLPSGTLLVTMDVVSLCSNIPHRDGLDTYRTFP
jgi:hypothetical protein